MIPEARDIGASRASIGVGNHCDRGLSTFVAVGLSFVMEVVMGMWDKYMWFGVCVL